MTHRGTFVSLFAGVGGFDLAMERAGYKSVGQCEIDPHACAVLERHWPNTPRHDDVQTLTASTFAHPDVVTFGSPCQDLSVAGARAGMVDGTRSGLFMDAVRYIREVQEASGGRYPRFAVWENVPGAFSSNNGADFTTVLTLLVGGSVRRPTGGWSNAGVAFGPLGSAEWRVLDSRYFGVAQRRRRVFLIYRPGSDSAGEVLLESDGVPRDSQESEPAREDVAGTLEARTRGGGFPGTDGAVSGHVVPALSGGHGGGAGHQYRQKGNEEAVVPEVMPTMRAGSVGTASKNQISGDTRDEYVVPVEVAPAVLASWGHHGYSSPRGDGTDPIVAAPAYSIRADAMREGVARTISPDAEGRMRLRDPGMGVYEEVAPTLDTGQSHGVAAPVTARDAKGPPTDATGIVPVSMRESGPGYWLEDDKAGPLRAQGGGDSSKSPALIRTPAPVAFKVRGGVEVDSAGKSAGKGYLGSEDIALTINAVQDQWLAEPTVAEPTAFAMRGREEGNVPEVHDEGASVGALRAASGGSTRDAVAYRIFTGDGETADPITSSEARTYTQEGTTFRMHNVVQPIPSPAVAFAENTRGEVRLEGGDGQIVGALNTGGGKPGQGTPTIAAPTLTAANDPSRSPQSSEVTQQVAAVHQAAYAVRRLTPRECERLQGFPDDWTITGAYDGHPKTVSDTHRYRMMGNAVTVNVVEWIARRLP